MSGYLKKALVAYALTVALAAPGETQPTQFGAETQFGTETIDEQIRTVELSGFTDPIVVMGPPSFNGGQPATVRVSSVSSSSFQYFLDEWDYLDGLHTNESIGYLALDRGPSILGGLRAEAGSVSVDDGWTTVSFSQAFAEAPVVICQVVSFNGSAAVTTRVDGVTAASFRVRIQEEEASDGAHALETVHWIAVEPGTAMVGSDRWIVHRSGSGVSDGFSTLSFGVGAASPAFIAQMQTTRDDNSAALRHRNLGPTHVEVKIEEEKSADAEVKHEVEDLGYLMLEKALGPDDDDQDGVPDTLEQALVAKFFPHLMMWHQVSDIDQFHQMDSPYDTPNWPTRVPYMLQPEHSSNPVYPCYEQNHCLRLDIGLVYEHDCGDNPDNGCSGTNNHAGDTEMTSILLARADVRGENGVPWSVAMNDPGAWRLIADFASAHWNVPIGDDDSTYGFYCRQGMVDCVGSSQADILYVAEGKHANYHSVEECDAGGFLGADRCTYVDNVHDIRDYPMRFVNIGNQSNPGPCLSFGPRSRCIRDTGGGEYDIWFDTGSYGTADRWFDNFTFFHSWPSRWYHCVYAGAFCGSELAIVATAPGPPQDLTATAGDDEVVLSWSPPADNGGRPVEDYDVQRQVDGTTQWLTLIVLWPSLTYTDTFAANGTTYHYRVRAGNLIGKGPWSAPVTVTPTAPAVLHLAATPYFAEPFRVGLTATWDPVPGAAHYRVTHYRENDCGQASVTTTTTGTSSSSGLHTNCGAPDSCYLKQVTVDAVGAQANVLVSESASLCEVGPAPPLDLTASSYFAVPFRVGLTASWDSIPGAAHYRVIHYREDDCGPASVTVTTTGTSSSSGLHTNCGAPDSCYLKRATVEAVSAGGNVFVSESASLCEVGPAPPLALTVTPSFGSGYRVGASAAWDPVPGAAYYRVIHFRENDCGQASVTVTTTGTSSGSGLHTNCGAPGSCYFKEVTVEAVSTGGNVFVTESGSICEVGQP